MQRIIFGSERMASTVPCQHRLAGCVVDHPAITGIHAVLIEQITGNVVTGNTPGRNCFYLGLIEFIGCARRFRWSDVLHHQVLTGVADP